MTSSFSYPVGGALLGALAIAAGVVYRAVVTSVHNYDVEVSTVLKTVKMPDFGDSGMLMYQRPWSRWPPYVVGILLGFVFFAIARKKKSIRMPCVSSFCKKIEKKFAKFFTSFIRNYRSFGLIAKNNYIN